MGKYLFIAPFENNTVVMPKDGEPGPSTRTVIDADHKLKIGA